MCENISLSKGKRNVLCLIKVKLIKNGGLSKLILSVTAYRMNFIILNINAVDMK